MREGVRSTDRARPPPGPLWLGLAGALGALGVAAAMALRRRNRPPTAAQGLALAQLRERRAADAQRARALDHALRTPLGTLAAACELLQTCGDDATLRDEARAVIGRQVAQLHGLADDWREFARRLER